MKSTVLLDASLKIANNIIESAIWKENKCTWHIYSPRLSKNKYPDASWERAGGTLYNGTAGIAFFVSEIFRVTEDKVYKPIIEGAINYALQVATQMPFNNYGFYNGRIGIAYVSIIAGIIIKSDIYIEAGLKIIKEMSNYEKHDKGIDVIGGAGGAIQPLLKLYELTRRDYLFIMAENLANMLIENANMEPIGWSWGMRNTNIRNLCGYAHGASGIGHAFLEMYNATQSQYYLYVAEQAFQYERQLYDQDANNWPDYRYSELNEYIHRNMLTELKDAISKDKLPKYKKRFMSAWCHGAPGIGLARLRAYELTQKDIYKNEAILTCDNIMSTYETISNYSLCHGRFGNLETLLTAARTLNIKKYKKYVKTNAIKAINELNNNQWPCGTINKMSDPNLMTGESGIGLHLLRLYNEEPETILAITSKSNVEKKDTSDTNLRKIYIDKYFKETVDYINKINPDGDTVLNAIKRDSSSGSEIEKAINYILSRLESLDDDHIKNVKDTFDYEMLKYNMMRDMDDYSSEYIHSLSSDKWNNVHSVGNTYVLSQYAKIFKKHNIEMFSDEEPNNSIDYYLLYCNNNSVVSQKLQFSTYLLYNALKNGANVKDLLSVLQNYYIIDDNMIDVLMDKIINIIINGLKKRILIKCDNNIPRLSCCWGT